MPFYARVMFQTEASAAERHDDEDSARRWIERERSSNPELFRLGQIVERGIDAPEIVATCDHDGWRDSR